MEPIDAKIKFRAIEILSKNLVARPEYDVRAPIEFHFDILVTSQVNPVAKIILIKVDVKAREVDKHEHCLTISVGCAFQIENFEDIIKKESENLYIIPPELDAILKSVSTSTSRGIIYSEVGGTYLINMVLPIVIFTPEQIKTQQLKEAEKVKQ